MPAVKTYTKVNFQNYPSTSTPLNATNLNKMDKGIDDLDDEVVAVKNTIENMSFDADAISYNNTQSGLQATDVQGAVDEINDNVTDGIGGTTDKFRFGTDGNGNYGYIKEVGGADTFFPFKSALSYVGVQQTSGNQTLSLNCNLHAEYIFICLAAGGDNNDGDSNPCQANLSISGNYIQLYNSGSNRKQASWCDSAIHTVVVKKEKNASLTITTNTTYWSTASLLYAIGFN